MNDNPQAQGGLNNQPDQSTFRAAWPWVMCVVGLDYFSSLAYQPSVAFSVAGKAAPIVTLGLVFATLFCAVPLYCRLAARSPSGSGSVGLLERLIPGWIGKFIVLIVLGFAATDLVFTRTFSAADAAEHLTHSPFVPWQKALEGACASCSEMVDGLDPDIQVHAHKLNNRQMVVTLILLVIGSFVAWVFRNGVTRSLVHASVVAVATYLVLTGITIAFGLVYLVNHPVMIESWFGEVVAGVKPANLAPESGFDPRLPLVILCITLFPKLALGMSGYELALVSMPLVRGDRIRNTRFLLIVSAVIMSLFLLASTFTTTLLIPPDAFKTEGQASNRATAYLAHGGGLVDGIEPASVCPFFGQWFGAAYDLSAAIMLTLAGITVMIGMRDLIPPYLYRLGMDWTWSQRLGMLMYLFTFLKLGVTYVTGADPDIQRGAYLTGVLSLFTFASFAAVVDLWKNRHGRIATSIVLAPIFLFSLVLFAWSTTVVIIATPAGFRMTLCFVGATLLVSMTTRFFRNTELRFNGFEFADEESKRLWQELIDRDIAILVPIRPKGTPIHQKESEIRKYHRLPDTMPVVFFAAELGDASDFAHLPLIRVVRDDGRVIAHLTRCASIPHVIAAAALEIAKNGIVPEVHFGWSSEHPLTANLNFVLFGQGNVPWMVYELIQASDAADDRKPRVMVG